MKKINSGINLFKLFSMFMIAQLHILGMGGIIGATEGTAAYYHAFFMQNAAFCAVNCYALASGYLMLGKKIRLSRIAGLWLEVFFYSVVISAIMMSVYRDLFCAQNTVHALTPIISNQYWYMTSYFLMYLFIPMMNKFAESASKKCFTAFLAAIFVIDDLRIFYRSIRIQIFRRLQSDMAHDYVPCRRVYEKIQYRRENEKNYGAAALFSGSSLQLFN